MRFLICARHYPPLISGGARRPYLFAKGLRELGHEVDIVAPELDSGEDGFCVPHINPQLPDTIEPSRAGPKLKSILRRAAYLPDPDIRWARNAKRIIAAQAKEYDVIMTSSPPESVHWIGASLKTQRKTTWIADLRDNWLDNPLDMHRRKPLRIFTESWLARRWLKRCDLIVAPTNTILEEARRHTRGRIPTMLVSQSCEAIPKDPAPKVRAENDPIHILHSGSFSLSDPNRSIEPSLALLSELIADGFDIRVSLIGRLTREEAELARRVLGANVSIEGVKPRNEVLSALIASDILLLSLATGTKAEPGKLAEYRAAGKPVLTAGQADWFDDVGLPSVAPNELLAAVSKGRPVPVPKAPPTPIDTATLLVEAIGKLKVVV